MSDFVVHFHLVFGTKNKGIIETQAENEPAEIQDQLKDWLPRNPDHGVDALGERLELYGRDDSTE